MLGKSTRPRRRPSANCSRVGRVERNGLLCLNHHDPYCRGVRPATANASQQSQLASTSITASGSVSDQGYRIDGTMVGYATGDSGFSATFTLDAPTDVFFIAVNSIAHHGATDPLSSDTATAAFSLTGGAINLSQETSFTNGLMDSSVHVLQALSLPSGTYTITASAHSFSGSPNFFETVNRINSLSSNASYSISISIVPEPSSLTLATIGVLGLVGAYFGRSAKQPHEPKSSFVRNAPMHARWLT